MQPLLERTEITFYKKYQKNHSLSFIRMIDDKYGNYENSWNITMTEDIKRLQTKFWVSKAMQENFIYKKGAN